MERIRSLVKPLIAMLAIACGALALLYPQWRAELRGAVLQPTFAPVAIVQMPSEVSAGGSLMPQQEGLPQLEGNPTGVAFGNIAQAFQFPEIIDQADLLQKVAGGFLAASEQFGDLAGQFAFLGPQLVGQDRGLAINFRRNFSALAKSSAALGNLLKLFETFEQLLGQSAVRDAVADLERDLAKLSRTFAHMNLLEFRSVAGSVGALAQQLNRVQAVVATPPPFGGPLLLVQGLDGFRASLLDLASHLATISASSEEPQTGNVRPFSHCAYGQVEGNTFYRTATFTDGTCGPWRQILSSPLPLGEQGYYARACTYLKELETVTVHCCFRSASDKFWARRALNCQRTRQVQFATEERTESRIALFTAPDDDEPPNPPDPDTDIRISGS